MCKVFKIVKEHKVPYFKSKYQGVQDNQFYLSNLHSEKIWAEA